MTIDASVEPSASPSFSIYESLRDKTLLVTGCTGFLGKVFLSLLLYQHPDVRKVYALVRPRKGEHVRVRFDREIAQSVAFGPLRERYGDALGGFLDERVEVVAGDVSEPCLGLSEELIARAAPHIDIIVNNAGLTDFTPSLQQAVRTNTQGALNLLALARRCDHAALLHTSTCFVTGTRDGDVMEDESPVGFYPRRAELKLHFSAERELEDCLSTIDHIHRQADDQERRALFTRLAREAIIEENRNPDHVEVLEAELRKQRGKWLEKTLKEEGKRRAEHWGWTNTYTYSKSMGEQLLWSQHGDIPFAIVRPAVVEGAMSFPTPGWNEGIVTCAPIAYVMYNGFRFIPTRPENCLDVVPVDFVAQATLMVTAGLLSRVHEPIYQVASSHRNPVRVQRLVELSTLSNRKFYARRTSEPRWKNALMTALESVTVDEAQYRRFSAPGVRRYASAVADVARSARKAIPGPLGALLRGVEDNARKVEKQSAVIEMLLDVFFPFIHEHNYVFHADALARLQAMLPAHEQHLGFRPEDIDWRHYWLDTAMPGLHKFVFPLIEEKLAKPRKKPYTYNDLIELFDASTENYRSRVAVQQVTATGLRRFTYGQLRDHAAWAAQNLRAAGLPERGCVLILSENRPEWGMAYFGVLNAGGTAVPVDAELSLAEVLNIARSCGAFALIGSDRVRDRLEREGLTEAMQRFEGEPGLQGWNPAKLRILGFDALFTLPERDETSALTTWRRPSQSEELASLIFTSGTTGRPKGVMLAHRNFTSLLASVNTVFDITRRDAFLSVLPMHHTFEFTAGFLMPLSRGASVTYLDEVSSDYLTRAFREVPPTAIIAVPALWQLLHRRIINEVTARGPRTKAVFDALINLNRWLRRRYKLNLGKTLFGSVHARFGGNIRYLISGAASLPAPIMDSFQGMGFDLLEGYGLTEAAPVLAVNRPGDRIRAGSVGRPLPGVEVRIHEPNEFGVGEIIARGGNVMLGYWNNAEATGATLRDGWLHTGDLGRFDDRGRLYIVGRRKEIIVSSSGENVYPDELEEIYGNHTFIEEISIAGIPDGQGGERVACMIRPKADVPGRSADEVRLEIRKHLDVQAARLNHPQRIKLLRFTDEALPRTATRKILRRKVAEQLEALAREALPGDVAAETTPTAWGSAAWLRDLLSTLVDTPPNAISLDAALIDDLGLDSLALVDLASGIQAHTGKEVKTDDLVTAGSARAILDAIQRSAAPVAARGDDATHALPGYSHLPAQMRPQGARRTSTPLVLPRVNDEVIELPSPVRDALRTALDGAQRTLYGEGFDVKVFGRANIPWNQNALVVANHCSHLDMGLVKHALREWAPELATLAASDYFFDNRAKRTYFSQLTNLIPMERTGSLDQSMARAVNAVRGGRPLLIFPEGTRSTTGEVAEFRQGLGYLVAASRTGVLPVYVAGTWRAMPKGSVVPKNRKLRVYIGEYLPFSFFEEKTRGMSSKQAWNEIANLTREAVLALKAGRRFLDGPKQDASPDHEATIRGLFEHLKGRFVEQQVDARVAYYFSLGEENHEKWTIVVEPTGCLYHPGKPVNGQADCVVKTDPAMFTRMVREGYVPSIDEFMSGKVKTSNPALLMTFQSVFGF